METITKIKDKLLEARRNKNSLVSFYSFVLSECQSVGKSKGDRESTEDEVQSVIKKLIASNKEAIKATQNDERPDSDELDGAHIYILEIENKFLESLRPEMISEDILSSFIKENCSEMQIGQAMGAIKKEFGTSVDMGVASNIFRNL